MIDKLSAFLLYKIRNQTANNKKGLVMPRTRRHPERFKMLVYEKLYLLLSEYRGEQEKKPTGERTHDDQNREFALRRQVCLEWIRKTGKEVGMSADEVQKLIKDTYDRAERDYNTRPRRG